MILDELFNVLCGFLPWQAQVAIIAALAVLVGVLWIVLG